MSHPLFILVLLFFFFFQKGFCSFVCPRVSNFFLFVSLFLWLFLLLPRSPGIFPSRIFLLPRPSPSPLPLAPALLQLPRQPVSFSPLRANRVEQPGRRGRRGRESLEQSDRIAGAPAPGLGGSSVQLSFPKCLGRWGQRCLGEALLPFLMKRATWRRGAPPQASASSH